MNAVVRKNGLKRREEILTGALELANTRGFNNFSSVELSKALGCSHSVVFYHFPSMVKLRDAVMELAIIQRNTKVLLDGLTSRNLVAQEAPEELKEIAKALLD